MAQIGYTLAAFGVVPALLGLFHWLSRGPRPTATTAPQVGGKAEEGARSGSLADEAERWLQSQV